MRHVMGFGAVSDESAGGADAEAARRRLHPVGQDGRRQGRLRRRPEGALLGGDRSGHRPIDSPIDVIEPGQAAGREFHSEVLVDGEPVVRMTVNWLMGEQNLYPAWTFGPEGQRYEMEVRGDPDVSVVVKGFQSAVGGERPQFGIVGTAAHCVNSIPAVCAAEPGIATPLDLSLISGRAVSLRGIRWKRL